MVSLERLLWQKKHSERDDFFQQQVGHKFREETSKVLYLEHSFVRC